MPNRPQPVFRTAEEVSLIGTMAIYNSQAEASEGIPRQWRDFRLTHPALGPNAKFYGASPCTDDRKIHYLTGIPQENPESPESPESPEISVRREPLTLAAAEYAVVRVDDAAQLRNTWIWLLTNWLPSSGRHEKNTPEFERFTSISDNGEPIGPVEIWIPLLPVADR